MNKSQIKKKLKINKKLINKTMSENNSQPKYLEDMTAKREESKARTLEQIKSERDEMDNMQRFGYFSIPYPAIVGDEAYSQNQEYPNHKVVDHKVIIEKRGIYTTIPKIGKTNDVYFSTVEPVSQEMIDKYKQMNVEQTKKVHDEIQLRKEKPTKVAFKPPGLSKLKGYYDEEHEPNDGPLFILPNKQRFIQGMKVVTEKRGVYSHATKLNFSLPSDLFSYPESNDFYDEILNKMKEDKKNKGNNEGGGEENEKKQNKQFKKPFQPASLNRCEPFANNEQTYGMYTEDEIEKGLNEYKDYKKHGNRRYEKILPPGSVKHMKAFMPAKLVSTGRDALFNDDLYKIPEIEEKKVKPKTEEELKKEEEEKKKRSRPPFTYNKLMNISTFSPPITSFSVNLKREFPSIKFH